MKTTIRSLLAALACGTLVSQASAGLLLAVEGTPVDGVMINTSGQVKTVLTTVWHTDHALSDVAIEAVVGRNTLPVVTGRAWLSTAVGVGTPASAVVAYRSFSLPYADPHDGGPAPQWLQLFSGLDLEAGTYHLTIASDSGHGAWYRDLTASVAAAPGLQRLGDDFSVAPAMAVDPVNAFASDFGFQHGDVDTRLLWRLSGEVVDQPSTVPLPASLWLLVAALPGLCLRRPRPASSTP